MSQQIKVDDMGRVDELGWIDLKQEMASTGNEKGWLLMELISAIAQQTQTFDQHWRSAAQANSPKWVEFTYYGSQTVMVDAARVVTVRSSNYSDADARKVCHLMMVGGGVQVVDGSIEDVCAALGIRDARGASPVNLDELIAKVKAAVDLAEIVEEKIDQAQARVEEE